MYFNCQKRENYYFDLFQKFQKATMTTQTFFAKITTPEASVN